VEGGGRRYWEIEGVGVGVGQHRKYHGLSYNSKIFGDF
jgi:hypothetical protein